MPAYIHFASVQFELIKKNCLLTMTNDWLCRSTLALCASYLLRPTDNACHLQNKVGVGGAVRFLVVGTIGQEERPQRGQLWMEQCLTSLKYWPL